jgi:predicted nucleotidyltransferase
LIGILAIDQDPDSERNLQFYGRPRIALIFYGFPGNFQLSRDLKMGKQEILKILNLVKAEAKKKYKVEIKGIFGSYSRGEYNPASDVDILVQFEDSADLFDFVGLGQFLEEKLKTKVDIVPQEDIRWELKDSILQETIYL